MFKFRAQSGVTLLEAVIYVALLGGAALAVSKFFASAQKTTADADERLVAQLEEQAAHRYLTRDLRNSTPSFHLPDLAFAGQPLVVDQSRRPFFALDSKQTCVQDCQREFRLEPGNDERKYFYFVSLDKVLGTPVPINPVEYYDASKAPSMTARGDLSFSETKFRQAVNENPDAAFLLNKGEVTWLYSPVGLGPQDGSRFPRFYSLFVERTESGTYSSRMPFLPRQPHPALMNVDLAAGFQSFGPLDTFFRMLPPVSGTSVMVMAAPVAFYRYFIHGSENRVNTLYRERYRAGEWGERQHLGTRLRSVVFNRDIRRASVQFEIARDVSMGKGDENEEQRDAN